MKRKINHSDTPSSSKEMNSKLVGYSIIISAILAYAILGYGIFAIYNHIFNNPGRSTNSSLSSSDVSVSPAQTPSVPLVEQPVSSPALDLALVLGLLTDKKEQSKVINAYKTIINTKTGLRIPVCLYNTHWDTYRGACIPNQPSCPPLTHWNKPRGICVPNQIEDCLLGEHWNFSLELCETNR
jgi:hypothetical protein